MPCQPHSGRAWLGVAVLCLTAFMTSIDIFVLLLALPEIAHELGATSVEQLWITDIYGFMLVGFMLSAGTLGDRIGRRRLLMIGASVFVVASIVAAFSISPLMLIAARAVLGIAGATLAPATLGLISGMFVEQRPRTLAISIWQMCFMGGALVGPVIGGLLLAHFWWGSVFLIGVPAMLILLALGPFLIAESSDSGAGRIDLPSVALSVAAILSTVYGIKELASHGLQVAPAAIAIVGLLLGFWFARRQRTLADPVLDIGLFANRTFAILAMTMVLLTVISSLMFFASQFLQLADGMPPLSVAYAMLPAATTSIVSIAITPWLARVLRPTVIIVGGMAISALGAVIITTASTGDPAPIVTGLALATLGNSPVVALGTTLILGSLPVEKAGSGGAIAETGTEFGFALGVALLGSLATVVYRANLTLPGGLSSETRDLALDGLTGALHSDLPTVVEAARNAYLQSIDAVGWSVAAVAGAIAVLALVFLRRIPKQSSAAATSPPVGTLL